MSAAATDESTPPDRPRMTSSRPTSARILATASSTWPGMVQSPAQPQMARNDRANLGVAEFAHSSGLDRASELRRHRLHAVADSQNGDARGPYCIRRARGIALDHTVRAAGQDDPRRSELADEGVGHVECVDLAI